MAKPLKMRLDSWLSLLSTLHARGATPCPPEEVEDEETDPQTHLNEEFRPGGFVLGIVFAGVFSATHIANVHYLSQRGKQALEKYFGR